MGLKSSLERHFRRLAVLFLLLGALPLAGQQLPLEMMVTNRFANVRKGPGSGYELIVTLYRGDRLRAERKYQNWLRVLIPDGRVGWVREDLMGPYNEEERPLTIEEADSLKTVVTGQTQRIAALEDSSRKLIAGIQEEERARDSLMSGLGLTKVPRSDTAAGAVLDTLGGIEPEPESRTLEQASVLTGKEEHPARWAFRPSLGVLIFNGDAAPAADFSVERNFTREFSYRGQVAFSRLDPADIGSLSGDIERTFITGGLAYSYQPGNLAVPFVELGAGAARTQAGNSTSTALDLVFGAGCRLFLTPDLSLEFGYQGNAVLTGGNTVLHLVYLGGGLHLPQLETAGLAGRKGKLYLSPYAGYQMFSPRFALNGAAVVGLRVGWSWRERLAFEFLAGYLPLELNEGHSLKNMSAGEIAGQVLYYPWPRVGSLFLLAGGGTLRFSGEGRPPAGTNNYAFFHYGAGVNLRFSGGLALRGELTQQIYTSVARLKPDYAVGAGSALRLSAGLNFGF